MSRYSIALIGAILFAVSASAQTPAPATPPAPATTGERSVIAGAYSEAQATLGEKVYQINCASCHEKSFHTDEQFRFNWFGRTVFDLFKVLKTTMPDDNIGGLSDDDYTRVIAYILKLNGFPAGADSLKADTTDMKLIRIAAPKSDTTKPPERKR